MTTPSEGERLNKFLALNLGISRRAADELIEEGTVSINGAPAGLGARVTGDAHITVDGKPVEAGTDHIYVAFHKPVGYVCSRKKQGEADTIYSLLPARYHTLNPVGRLDKDSSGLLLLTNDGDFAFQMTHPKFRKTKIYTVTLDQPLQPLHQQMIADFGIDLTDGKSRLILEKLSDDNTSWRITMSEGRNRQIRRTFASLGYTVAELHRDQFGPYRLEELPEGGFQEVGSDGAVI